MWYHRALRYGLRNKKWLFTFFLLVIPFFYVATFIVHRTHTVYYLYTGPAGGTRQSLGQPLADALNKPDRLEAFLHLNLVPDFVVRSSCGSVENVYFINQSLAQVAFAEDGLPLPLEAHSHCSVVRPQPSGSQTSEAVETQFRVLMPLYLSPLHIVAQKSLHVSEIRALPSHAKVYLGPEGRGTAVLAQLIFCHYGMVMERYGADLNFEQAKQALLHGEVDAGVFLTAIKFRRGARAPAIGSPYLNSD